MWRDIKEDGGWDECRQKIEPDAERFDDLFRAIGIALSRNPKACSTGLTGPDDNHRVLITEEYPGVPELWVYFRIEAGDACCALLWIERPEPPTDEEAAPA